MAPYAAREDLLARYGDEIKSLEAAEGKTQATTAAALADAAAEINGYLGARYRLPLAGTYPILTWLCCDIARFRLWEARLEDGEDNAVYVRYRKTLAFLERLASGEGVLTDEEGASPLEAASADGAAVASRRRPVFTSSIARRMDYGS